MGNVVKGALNFNKNMRGNVPEIVVPKPLKALKSLAAMGGVSQQRGERRGDGVELEGMELRESRRAHQPSCHPLRVTLEALNIAAQLMTAMDRKERRLYSLS